jgi:hypothetical protein
MAEKKVTAEEAVGAATVHIDRLKEAEIRVPVKGITPLISHKWSEKALKQMRDKQFGKQVSTKHAPKNPEEEAEQALYRLGDGSYAFPATAFKAAAVNACSLFGKDVAKVVTKQVLHVVGEGPEQLVKIEGEKHLREDTPRISMGKVDLRYRYQIWPWSAILTVRFLPQVLSADSLVALIDAGGRGGIGDWRPSAPKSSTGTYGQFVVTDEEVS